jgi:transcriptional regulator with XRE-family HTH domain
MAFHKNTISQEDSNVPQGSIGSKINKFRELRNLSQKELGVLCGFKASGADARIVQYEKMKRVPSKETLEDVSKALGISKYALYDLDLAPVEQMFQLFFDLSYLHGLVPVMVDDKIYLGFENDDKEYEDKIEPFLKQWYDARLMLEETLAEASTDEEKEINNDFALWCAEYPYGQKAQFGNYRDIKKMEELQKEMDELNAKIHSAEEERKIKQAIDKMKPVVLNEYKPIEKASDFCFILLRALEAGLVIEWHDKERGVLFYDADRTFTQEFSFKTSNILSTRETKTAFTEISCAIETLEQQYEVMIEKRITSIKNELWLDYYFHTKVLDMFCFVHKVWSDMCLLAETKRNKSIPDSEKVIKEEAFRKMITGDNDLILQKPFTF